MKIYIKAHKMVILIIALCGTVILLFQVWSGSILNYGNVSLQGVANDGYNLERLYQGNSYLQEFSSNYDNLESVSCYIITPEIPIGDLNISVRSVDGNRTLAKKAIAIDTIPNAEWHEVPLSCSLEKNKHYILVMDYTDGNISKIENDSLPDEDNSYISLVINPQETKLYDEKGNTRFTVMEYGENGTLMLGFSASEEETTYVTLWISIMSLLFFALLTSTLFSEELSSKTQAIETNKRQSIESIIIFAMLVVQFLLIVPNVVYKLTGLNLDPSWMYFLNVANSEGYKFGSDVYFTYGPLGFLCYLMNLGNKQYVIGILLWGVLFAFNIVLYLQIFRLYKHKKIRFSSICLSFLCYLPLLFESQRDNYMLYLLILSIIIWSFGESKMAIISNILLCLMFFSKFSTFTSGMAFIIVFVAIKIIFERKWKALEIFMPAFATVPFLYLAYNNSFTSLINYVVGMFRISSGWMKTQQWDNMFTKREMNCMIAIILLYLVIIVLTVYYDKKNSAILIAGCISLFLAYKYGVGAHGIAMSIWLTSMLFSELFLAVELNTQNKMHHKVNCKCAYLVLVACCFSITMLQAVNLHSSFAEINSVLYAKGYTLTHITESSITDQLFLNVDVPESIRNEIGQETVTSYPWETGYKAVYPSLNVVYSPSVQNCNLFIPWLDKKEADFYYSDNAPKYIIMKDGVIFNHIKGLENPLTWEAIADRYEVTMMEEDYNLLHLRKSYKKAVKTYMYSQTYNKNEIVICPSDADYCIIHIGMTQCGKLKDLLFRAGMTFMNIEYQDGTECKGSLVMPNLESGFYLKDYPQTLADVSEVLNNGKATKMTSFQMSGTGLKVYEDKMIIDWYSVK